MDTLSGAIMKHLNVATSMSGDRETMAALLANLGRGRVDVHFSDVKNFLKYFCPP